MILILKSIRCNSLITLLFLSSIYLAPVISYSQCINVCGTNLVPNGNFEATNSNCSDTISEMFYSYTSVNNWYGTDDWTCYPQPPSDCGAGSTPDYHNSNCNGPSKKKGCGVGSGAAGIFNSVNVGGAPVSGGTVSYNREYIQVKLSTPLVAGKEYCASMIVRSDDSNPTLVPSDGIGMWFTNQKINIDTQNGGQQYIGIGSTINAIPQVQNPSGNIIGNNCTVVSGTFCAKGGEEWLVIGNFRPDSSLNTNSSGFLGLKINYMLIDDVSVKAICPPNPQLQLSKDSISCGNSIDVEIINVPTGATVKWISPTNFTGYTSTGKYSDAPNSTTIYSAVVTINSGCGLPYKDTLSDTLFVKCGPDIMLSLQSDTLCKGSCTKIKAKITGGLSPYTVIWNNGIAPGPGPHTVCPSLTTVYKATVIDDNGNKDSSTITLDIIPPDSIYIKHKICSGDSIYLNGKYISSSGIYPQVYTNIYGCDSIEYHEIVILPTPTYTTSTKKSTCGNADGEIVIIPDSGFTITDFSIDGGITTQSVGTFNNLNSNTYNINITDNNGCVGTGSLILSNIDGPTIDSISTTTVSCIANDGTITVFASGGSGLLDYELDNGQTSANGTFTGLADGDYVVTVSDKKGCIAIQNISIKKANKPVLSIINSTNASCFGANDGSAEINASGGTPPYSYSWSPNVGTTSKVTDLARGTYTVTVLDSAGCSNTMQITISEPTEMKISGIVENTICGHHDGKININASGGNGNYSYEWEPNISTTNEATNLAIGTYKVTVTDSNGCNVSSSFNVIANSSFYINAIPDDATIMQGESVNINLFVDTIVSIDSIIWTPTPDLSCSDCINLIASPDQSTTYIVTAVDTNGCISTDTVVINVVKPCAKVFVPNSFSPNNDEINDLQCVLGECIIYMEFTIFDRWGEIVFQTKDQEECWDGTFRGKMVQSGSYIYKLKATLKNGKQIKTSGNLTLVR